MLANKHLRLRDGSGKENACARTPLHLSQRRCRLQHGTAALSAALPLCVFCPAAWPLSLLAAGPLRSIAAGPLHYLAAGPLPVLLLSGMAAACIVLAATAAASAASPLSDLVASNLRLVIIAYWL